MKRFAALVTLALLVAGSASAQWPTPARKISVSTNAWTFLQPTEATAQATFDYINAQWTDWSGSILTNMQDNAANASNITALATVVSNNYSDVTGRVAAVALQFRPIARYSTGFSPAYQTATSVLFSAGSIFGPTGTVYVSGGQIANVFPLPNADAFVYFYIDASASTAESIVIRSSVTDIPVQNDYLQWVSDSEDLDRYIGCVLWSQSVDPAGIVKFVCDEGAYRLCDTRIYPTNSVIDGWDDVALLGDDQEMTGAWLDPENDASERLPETAIEALVAVSVYNKTPDIDAHSVAYAVATKEEATLHASGVFMNSFTGTGPYTNENTVAAFPPTDFSGRSGNNMDNHKHEADGGIHVELSDVPSEHWLSAVQWKKLGSSRDLRIAGDKVDGHAVTTYADWGLLGWKEIR